MQNFPQHLLLFLTKRTTDKFGNVFYKRNGRFHNEDGPAVIWANGGKEWWINGKCHRTDGPALTLADGTTKWYQNGILHREDGPAITRANGDKEYVVNGQRMTEEEFLQRKQNGSGS